MKSIVTVLTLFIFSVTYLFANDPEDGFGIVKGRVTTADGKTAPSVTVLLKGTKKAALTEDDGTFTIHHVPEGSYDIEISQVGHATIIQHIVVESNKVTAVAIQLKISEKELQEVVVTNSRKRFSTQGSDYVSKMPLRNMENPQVYSSITKPMLTEQLVFTVDDAMRNATGMQKVWDATGRSGDGGSYYNIRGFLVQSQFRNGIAGVVSNTIDAANLERVEIMKGPSATLFGSALTSYGGLINRVTKKPYDRFGGEINYSTGSYKFNRISADINIPLDSAKKLLLRMNTAYSYEGSFQDNGFSKGFVLAPSVSYKINDRLSLLMDGEFYTGQNTGLRVFFFPYMQTIASLGVNRADQLNVDYKRSYSNNDLYQTGRSTNFFGQMNYTLSNNWKSLTSFTLSNSFSDGPSPYFYLLSNAAVTKNVSDVGNGYISRNDQLTDNSKDRFIELQQNFTGEFNIGRFKNRFVGGLDYIYHKADQFFSAGTYDTIKALGDIPTYGDFNRTNMDKLYMTKGYNFVYPVNYTSNTYSAYASDLFNVTDNIMLLAALRIDHFNNKGPKDSAKTFVNATPYDQTTVSPKFGIVFQPIKDKISIFGNYQNGFTNKQGTDFITQKAFKPEQANQLEGGVKVDLFSGRLSNTVSVYHIEVTDIIRTAPDNPNFNIQDGTQVSKGIEAEVIASPINGMNLIAGVSYNDSKYTKADADVEGRRPGTASSPWLANWWISYRLPAQVVKGLGVGFGGNYASDNKVINNVSQGVFILPAYTILNASVFFDQPKFRISAKMDNITNQKYWIGYTTVNPQKLRSIVASIAFKF
jgi:iron complex outermembrane receptor protein